MKKVIALAAAVCFAMAPAYAQKKYEKIMYQDNSAQNDEVMVKSKDGVSTAAMTKFKLQITNKTNDLLFYKPDESYLKLGDKQVKPEERSMQIDPNESESKVINFKGTDYMVNAYSYVVNGLYKVSLNGKPTTAPDFDLPASKNVFTAGNFNCTMTDLKKESDETTVKFECKYTGDKVGIINPVKTAVKRPDGVEIANAGKKSPIILNKGESEKFTLKWNRMEGGKVNDMQKIKLLVLWRDCFTESDMVKLNPLTLDLKIDEATSK